MGIEVRFKDASGKVVAKAEDSSLSFAGFPLNQAFRYAQMLSGIIPDRGIFSCPEDWSLPENWVKVELEADLGAGEFDRSQLETINWFELLDHLDT